MKIRQSFVSNSSSCSSFMNNGEELDGVKALSFEASNESEDLFSYGRCCGVILNSNGRIKIITTSNA